MLRDYFLICLIRLLTLFNLTESNILYLQNKELCGAKRSVISELIINIAASKISKIRFSEAKITTKKLLEIMKAINDN